MAWASVAARAVVAASARVIVVGIRLPARLDVAASGRAIASLISPARDVAAVSGSAVAREMAALRAAAAARLLLWLDGATRRMEECGESAGKVRPVREDRKSVV